MTNGVRQGAGVLAVAVGVALLALVLSLGGGEDVGTLGGLLFAPAVVLALIGLFLIARDLLASD